MSLDPTSSLPEVVAVVGRALKDRGIRAVLTGDACASLYSGGAYTSFDVDFILQSAVDQTDLDGAMAAAGFSRRRDHYVHPTCSFWVEFPAGPLGLGADLQITPVPLRVRHITIPALSATDSCRDRLTGYYHWNDVQALDAAVAIAARRRVDLRLISRWSQGEGAAAKFATFRNRLTAARRRS